MTELAPLPTYITDLLSKSKKSSESGTFMIEGRRNNDLTRLGGFLYRATGADAQELTRMLQNFNLGQANPLAESEVAGIARSISSYDRSPIDKVDELHLSKTLSQELRDEFCFCVGRGWMYFNGRHWVRDVGEKRIQERVKVYLLALYEAVSSRNSASDGTLLKAITSGLRAGKVKNLILMASSVPELLVDADTFDAQPNVMNVLNGTLEFGGGEIERREHRASDYLTTCADVEYDPEANAPHFKKLLSDALDKDTGDFLMRFFGYVATGHANQRVYAIFYGKGANGKSTIANVIQDLLGGYAVNVEPATFLQARNGQTRSDLARLMGTRLAVSSEFGTGQIMDAPLLKQLVGNDKITARRLYEAEIEFKSTVVPLFVTNALPVINGGDEALAARIIVVPFLKTIPPEDRDPLLPEKLWAERSGIFNLLLEGMRDYLTDRELRRPQSVIGAVNAYVKDSDLLGQFVEDCCVLDASAKTPASELYAEYCGWCIQHGVRSMTQPTFKSEMINKTGVYQSRTSRGQVWVGMRLKAK